MATVTLPATVADDQEIVTSWGNAVVRALTELLGDALNNGVMVGDGTRSVKFVAPSGSTDLVFKFNASAGTVEFSADAGSASFTQIGQALVALVNLPAAGDVRYLKVARTASGHTVTAVDAAALIGELIPSGTSRPAGLAAGRLWIDTDA